MAYGDHGGAVGYLVGEENRGLEYMFIMMNARALLGRARRRGASPSAPTSGRSRTRASACRARRSAGQGREDASPIIHHPDVRRMLMTMKAQTEAMRARRLCHWRRRSTMRTQHPGRQRARASIRRFVDFMIPIVKGWCTEMAHRGRLARRAGARRHGLHRGNRRRAAPPRCAHHDDLRRHDRHPGERPGRAQDRARLRRGRQIDRRRDRQDRGQACGTQRTFIAGDRCAAGGRHRRSAVDDRLDGTGLWAADPRRACGCGGVSQVVGARGRRLADGARRIGRGGSHRRRHRRSAISCTRRSPRRGTSPTLCCRRYRGSRTR